MLGSVGLCVGPRRARPVPHRGYRIKSGKTKKGAGTGCSRHDENEGGSQPRRYEGVVVRVRE